MKAKLQWCQNPSQMNADNLNNVRHETSRHASEKWEIFEDKIMKQTEKTKMLEAYLKT